MRGNNLPVAMAGDAGPTTSWRATLDIAGDGNKYLIVYPGPGTLLTTILPQCDAMKNTAVLRLMPPFQKFSQ